MRWIILTFTGPRIVLIASIMFLIFMSFDNAYNSHIDDSMGKRSKSVFSRTTSKTIVHLIFLACYAGQVVKEYTYFNGMIDLKDAFISYIATNVAIILLFLAFEYAKSRIFSGLPYASDFKKARSVAIKKTILRYFAGIAINISLFGYLSIHSLVADKDMEQWISGNKLQGYLMFISIFLLSIIGELFPIYYSLDFHYLTILAQVEPLNSGATPLLTPARFRTFFSSANSKSSGVESKKELYKVFMDHSKVNLKLFKIVSVISV